MHQDYKKYKFLSELFPNQFRTIPGIILWTLVFLADVALVFWVAHLLGFSILNALNKAVLMVYLLIAFALFCLESWLYNLIRH